MIKILFLCHGNICRSTMAEFVMKDLIKKAGLSDEIFVASAACRRDEIGADTYYATKDKLREKGIPFTPRHAVQVTLSDYEKYNCLIGMDDENRYDLLRLTDGDPLGKVHLLLDFTHEDRPVADPWYTRDFEATYDDVLRGCKALLQTITAPDI